MFDEKRPRIQTNPAQIQYVLLQCPTKNLFPLHILLKLSPYTYQIFAGFSANTFFCVSCSPQSKQWCFMTCWKVLLHYRSWHFFRILLQMRFSFSWVDINTSALQMYHNFSGSCNTHYQISFFPNNNRFFHPDRT